VSENAKTPGIEAMEKEGFKLLNTEKGKCFYQENWQNYNGDIVELYDDEEAYFVATWTSLKPLKAIVLRLQEPAARKEAANANT